MHEAVPMLHPAFEVEIDVALVDLVRVCWSRGLATRYCCEGTAGKSYVQFVSGLEAALFAALAGPMTWTREEHDERLRGPGAVKPDRWREWVLTGDATVTFPRRDIGRATAALRRARFSLAELKRAHLDLRENRPTVRRCRSCRGAIAPWLRRDAVYCSRSCQLRGRRRAQRASS
jgi:hypothetical protein